MLQRRHGFASIPPCQNDAHTFSEHGLCMRCGQPDGEKFEAQAVERAKVQTRLEYRMAVSNVAMQIFRATCGTAPPSVEKVDLCINLARKWVDEVNGLTVPEKLLAEAETDTKNQGDSMGPLYGRSIVGARFIGEPIG